MFPFHQLLTLMMYFAKCCSLPRGIGAVITAHQYSITVEVSALNVLKAAFCQLTLNANGAYKTQHTLNNKTIFECVWGPQSIV